MGTLALSGPWFLLVYTLAVVVAVLVGRAIAKRALGPARQPHPTDLDRLGPEEIAYLVSGADGAIDTAVARLVATGRLASDGARERIVQGRTASEKDALRGYRGRPALTKLEQQVLEHVPDGGAKMYDLRVAASSAARALEPSLVERLLVTEGAQRAVAWALPLGINFAVIAAGALRIAVGVEHGMPVGILLALVVIHFFVALLMFGIAGDRRLTRRGALAVAALRRRNAALAVTARVAPEQLTPRDTALAVALFGGSTLGAMALGALLTPGAAGALADGVAGDVSYGDADSGGSGGCGGCGGWSG